MARRAGRITVTTSLGTELVAASCPFLKWVSSDGGYWEQGRWGNLPEGETFTCPASVDGVIAAEEMGDWFTEKYGMLSPAVRFVMQGGRIVSIETPDLQLAADIRDYMAQDPNSSRVGEFAIGTNVGLSEIVGNFLQDEKFPGVHRVRRPLWLRDWSRLGLPVACRRARLARDDLRGRTEHHGER